MSRQEDDRCLSDRYSETMGSIITSQSQVLSIEILTTDYKFYELKNEWNDLLSNSSSDSIFLTWEWVSTWWKYFHSNSAPWIITARHPDTNQLLGIAPLVIKSIRNLAHFFDLSKILNSGIRYALIVIIDVSARFFALKIDDSELQL